MKDDYFLFFPVSFQATIPNMIKYAIPASPPKRGITDAIGINASHPG